VSVEDVDHGSDAVCEQQQRAVGRVDRVEVTVEVGHRGALLAQGRRVIGVHGAVVREDEQRPPVRAEGEPAGAHPDWQLEAGDRRGAAQQGRQQRALGLLAGVEIDGLACEQDRQVDPRLDHGLGTEPLRERDASLAGRVLLLHERQDSGDHGDDQQRSDPREHGAQPARRASGRAPACAQKLPLDRAQLVPVLS
jgi:hypothetical protein